jgi:hypothetical protein
MDRRKLQPIAGKYIPEMSDAKQVMNLAPARGGQSLREFISKYPAFQRESPEGAFDRRSFGFSA